MSSDENQVENPVLIDTAPIAPRFIQQYFVDRLGYRCGRCGRTGFVYAGEPHADLAGRTCEPPNTIANSGQAQADTAKASVFTNVANTTEKAPSANPPPLADVQATLSDGTVYNPAADPANQLFQTRQGTPEGQTVIVERTSGFPNLKPIRLDANGDVVDA